MQIVILEPLGVEQNQLDEITQPLKTAGHEITAFDQRTTDAGELGKRLTGADIAVIANSPLPAAAIKQAEDLKMISVAFTGVDHVDMATARKKDITVSNAAGYSTAAVSELTFGLTLALQRSIVPLDQAARSSGTMTGSRQQELTGKTFGVVGTGAIGQAVAKVALAFGCQVVAYNRSQNDELLELGVKYLSLDELLKTSDIVSLHLPLNDDTRGLIGKNQLAQMKSSALLINTARGPVVDEAALARALNSGQIAGAGIDVFSTEPPIDASNPVLTAKNTVTTPHIGFASDEAMVRRAKIVFANISAWLDGQPQNVVN